MSPDEIVGTLRDHEGELRRLGLARLYLFGSTARGEQRPHDIDLLFEIGEFEGFNLLSQAAATNRIEELLGLPVDLVERARLHPLIQKQVESEMVDVF